MKNTTDHTAAQWPVRNDSPRESLRTREMPLLFQLADVNRATAAATSASAASSASVATPPTTKTPFTSMPAGAIEMAPLPGKFPLSSFPLASATLTSGELDPWPAAPQGLFETSTTLPTSALAVTASPRSSTSLDLATPPVENKPEPAGSGLASNILPAAIDSAVKAADAASDAMEVKTEAKSEPKIETKPAPQANSASEAKVDAKSEAKAEVKSKMDSATPAATPAPPATDKPSPGSLRRQRAEARQQKVAGQGSDWLASHGKFIAIGFVIALIGTIYLARRNREVETPVNPAEPPNGLAIEIPGDHADHQHEHAEVANTAPRLTETPSHPLDGTPSPAVTPAAPANTAAADLHPPVVPSTSPPTTAPNGEPLFPWQNNDPRMATRPENAPPGGTAPNAAPALNPPTYPETNLRDAPLLPPAPPASPGPAYAPPAGQGSGSAPARSYPASFTSAPGGNRYERTGSGLY